MSAGHGAALTRLLARGVDPIDIAVELQVSYGVVAKFIEYDRGSPDGDGPPKPEHPQPTPITKRPSAEICAGSGGAMTRTDGGAAGGDHALNAARLAAGSEPARGHHEIAGPLINGGATPPSVPSPAEVRPAGVTAIAASGATSPAEGRAAPPPLQSGGGRDAPA